MRNSQGPERWVVSTEAPPELRALLEVARREGPSLSQRASLGTRLGLPLQQALVGFGAKSVAIATVVAAGAVGAGLGLYSGQEAPPMASPPASAMVVEPVASESAPDPVTPPETTTNVDEVDSRAAPPAVPPTKPPSEAFLIRSARSALSTSPRRARAYLERHHRLYADGQLAQEREVLLIEVLRLEGHEADADARAQEFRQKNPDSAHRPSAQ